MQPAQIAFEFIECCRGEPSLGTVLRELSRCTGLFGFDSFMLTGLPWPHERFERHVLLNGWSEEWYERFTRRDYFHLDCVGQWALRTCMPFTHVEIPDALRRNPAASRIRAEAKAFGFADGLVVPIRSAWWRQSAVSFSCDRHCDLGPHERSALHLVAIYAEATVRESLAKTTASEKLTAREREVLAWAAQGKSAWETSVILSLSERTVTKHLEHVRAKLNVATTAQAVAEGFRIGEIAL